MFISPKHTICGVDTTQTDNQTQRTDYGDINILYLAAVDKNHLFFIHFWFRTFIINISKSILLQTVYFGRFRHFNDVQKYENLICVFLSTIY